MRIILCLSLLVAMMGIASADVYSDNAKAAQDVADKFFKAIADKDFDAYKANCSSARCAEFIANGTDSPIKLWWDGTQDAVIKHQSKWEFVSVKINMPAKIGLDYKRTCGCGKVSSDYIELVKEGDKWLVDAANSLSSSDW